MLLSLRILSLVCACIGGGLALVSHRRSAGLTATQWGARASLLLSLAIVIGTAPALVFPSHQWVSVIGSFISLALTGASLGLLRRQRQSARSKEPTLDD